MDTRSAAAEPAHRRQFAAGAPLPWFASPNNSNACSTVHDADGICIGTANSRNAGMDAPAIAVLFAAAPELAYALYLSGLHSDYEVKGDPQPYFCLCEAGRERPLRNGVHTTVCALATAALRKAGRLG